MFKWLKKIRQQRNDEIAQSIYKKLKADAGWDEFLPPVACRDCVYMVTKSGAIYKMHYDHINEMEMIVQLRR